jgi:ribosomal protein S18 acetylase RimI-like enzyme
MLSELQLELARNDHAEVICNLVNRAYRGEKGWTKETGIIDGNRTNVDEIRLLISNPNALMFITSIGGEVAACICIEIINNSAYISLFSVSPAYQDRGLGKQIINLAENYARNQLCINKLIMVVISQRKELIAFYERRGYKRTGKVKKYPVHLNAGTPRIKGLTLEYLEKNT